MRIDIFQGGYFLGEVFCLGLGFMFLTRPPRILCVVIFICGNFFPNVVVFLGPQNCPQFRKTVRRGWC